MSRATTFCTVAPYVFFMLSMESFSCHPASAYNFEVASMIWETCLPLHQLLVSIL